jgi:phosphoglycolate phosphatase-like HAD superfamily hydrolase
MQEKLVLFDIDGTLLLSGGAGKRALTSVMTETVGDPEVFGRVRFDGKTDPQIIIELLLEAGQDCDRDDPRIAALAERYLETLERELSDPSGTPPALMPGVEDLLGTLEADGRVTIGLLTGNLVQGATLKLRSVGLEPDRFVVGAFGSDSPHRPDLPAIAAERAGPIFGRVPWGEEVVIIGDTPADVTCGVPIGARAIAVATGNYAVADLAEAGAHTVVADLVDAGTVMDAIFA